MTDQRMKIYYVLYVVLCFLANQHAHVPCTADGLQALITPDTKLVVVNFPHNPTGATLSAADYTSLIDHCRSVGAWLFSDEMYRFTGWWGRYLRRRSHSSFILSGILLHGISARPDIPGRTGTS